MFLDNPLFLTLIGAILGGLSAVGVGGGSLLLLWLTLVIGTDPEQARLMNLMFFLPCALSATVFRWKQGSLPVIPALWAVAAGCCGAFLGNLLRQNLDLELTRKFFGVLFLLCGIRELFYRPRKAR